mmetsp:Transcript_9153/g.19413  ORF Transcript_9153/g.19413 Transcript_9153/m.19413 type:complete len:110 (-) Transcript_9153:80-409(-)
MSLPSNDLGLWEKWWRACSHKWLNVRKGPPDFPPDHTSTEWDMVLELCKKNHGKGGGQGPWFIILSLSGGLFAEKRCSLPRLPQETAFPPLSFPLFLPHFVPAGDLIPC